MTTSLLRMLLVALAVWASPSKADLFTYTGTTIGDPTFNRPLEDLSGLSGVGTAVRYDTLSFRVSTNGEYTFLNTSRFDPFLYLYAPSLNPALPLASAQKANDDLLGLTTSGFAHTLTAGVDYTLVTTGFSNVDFGAFSNTIGGPGTIITGALPAPVSTPTISTFTGSTIGDPAFNRPLEDLSGLSGVGTAVRYDTLSFRVSTNGEYTFLNTSRFDPFLYLYAPSLNPALPLASAQKANDDLLGLTTSGFAHTLTAGVDYTLVTTGFSNVDFGAFSNTIGGPGRVLLAVSPPAGVPLPSSLAVLLAGLLAFVAARPVGMARR